MKVGKPKSKRQPVRLRHKIEKASAAKQRKQKKFAKKNPEWRTRLKKDPGIPNLFPYKDKILAEIEERKKLKEEEKQKRRDQAMLLNAEKSGSSHDVTIGDDVAEDGSVLMDYAEEDDDESGVDGADVSPMAALLASARARATEFDHNDPHGEAMDEDSGDADSWDGIDEAQPPSRSQAKKGRKDSSRSAFTSYFNELVSSADVVLYVLDARDPLGTRSRPIERQILATNPGSKRLIYILNKIDLVPPRVLKAWLQYLRRYFPTLPLRASNPAANAKTWDHKALTNKGTSETLVKALKSYAASEGTKGSIRVGIAGFPNVGKSSVINALRSRLGGRNDACPVGAEAGVTTSLREVKLDGKIKLIDSPGIVFQSGEEDSTANGTKTSSGLDKNAEQRAKLILLNAVPPKEIQDPVPAATLLLSRLTSLSDSAVANAPSGTNTLTPLDAMLKFYDIPTLMPTLKADGIKDLTTDFLVQVARKRGRLGKGGVPNLTAAAFTVLTDWRDGRIQGWVEAPKHTFDIEQSKDVTMGGADVDQSEMNGSAKDQKKIVDQWAAEFKLEGLWGDGDDKEIVEDPEIAVN